MLIFEDIICTPFILGGFVQLEHLAWCGKLAVHDLRPVNGNRRWSVLWNDNRIKRLAELLEAGNITPIRFLLAAYWTILGPVNHRLRFNGGNPHQHAESESDGDPDSPDTASGNESESNPDSPDTG